MGGFNQARPFAYRGPDYAWRLVFHPYAAAAFLSVLIVVPYCLPFTMQLYFPSYRHFATLEQHLVISLSLSMVIFAGVIAGIATARRKTPERIAANVRLLKGDAAFTIFALLLGISWIVCLILIPLGLGQLDVDVTEARMSMKAIGGISFLSRLSSVVLLPLLVCCWLRGRPVKTILFLTAGLTLLQGIATAERFAVVQLFLVVGIAIALYRPYRLRFSTAALGAFLIFTFLVVNLGIRILAPLSQDMRPQISRQLPQIALGTLLTYPSDTMNKLYFELFERVHAHGKTYFYFLSTYWHAYDRILGTQVLEENRPASLRQAYTTGEKSALDYLGGRNTAMTNVGGPAQDYLDFGILFPFVLFLKFFVFARIYAAARQLDMLSICLLPSFFGSAITYTQDNMLYEVSSLAPVLLVLAVFPCLKQIDRQMLRPALAV
jgi:hypothetical protein